MISIITSIIIKILKIIKTCKIIKIIKIRKTINQKILTHFFIVIKTEGPKLAQALEEHVKDYNIDVMNLQRAKRLEKKEFVEVELENGAILKSKAVILSTGARWRYT